MASHAVGGGFKGMLAKAALAPMSSPIGPADLRSAASVPALGTTAPAMLDAQPSKPSGQSALGPPEPTLQDAQVKASSLFRPGSAVAVNSSSKQGHKPGSAVGCSRSRRPGHFTMLTPVDAAAGRHRPSQKSRPLAATLWPLVMHCIPPCCPNIKALTP